MSDCRLGVWHLTQSLIRTWFNLTRAPKAGLAFFVSALLSFAVRQLSALKKRASYGMTAEPEHVSLQITAFIDAI